MFRYPSIKLSVLAVGALALQSLAAAPSADDLHFFEQKIQPLLADHCYKCHSHAAEKIKGGLVLDSLSGLIKGGDSGPALVPGKPEESLLIKAVGYSDPDLQMPPKGKKLSPGQIADLQQWVRIGAPWPAANPVTVKARGKISEADRKWWAFQPVREPPVPNLAGDAWSRNAVDKFILAKLQSAGLQPSPEADRRTFIRRVYFDLWGLPPTPEETAAFVSDRSPQAWENLVDRLLASPRYGERWGRYWLDLVRFAESDGYKADSFRPNAWRYRDYVIAAFNQDKPYDQFIREQLAGDELAPDSPEAAVGTMFLRHTIYEYNNPDARGQWEAILNELTDVTGDVFMGLGMSCARCHDHKYDPILQKDYYRLQAFFAPILPRDDLSAASARETAEYQEKLGRWREMTRDLREQIGAIEENYREANFKSAIRKFPDDIQEILLKPSSARTPYEEQVAQLAERQVTPAFEQIETKLKGEQKEKLLELRKQLAEFDSFKPAPLPATLGVTDVGPIAPPTVIPKSRSKEEIAPGFLTVFEEQPATIQKLASAPHSTGRRAALAQWLARADNPLSTRVMVNRVWQSHFGRGIVATASDFGRLGQPPSHPELLDWLTSRFVQEGWSVKKLHRLILTSAAYRQSSTEPPPEMALKKDPDNALLWRMSVHRLDAEEIRDSILMATGELDLEMGGPSVDSTMPRRSIYTKVRRNTHDPLLEAFDAPDHIASMPQRNVTTTPTQALLLFNSQSILQRTKALAARLEKTKPRDDAEVISTACRLTLGRPPDAAEAGMLARFFRQQSERIAGGLGPPHPAPFLAEPMPARDGKAALFDPEGPQKQFEVPPSASLPDGDFTVEAIVLLKSVYQDGAVRTIAAHWDRAETHPGWSFGVTGRNGPGKPQHLILQLAASSGETSSSETVLSDWAIELNKPYFVAASVRLGETNQSGITFYAKNLANDEEPLQISRATHHVTGTIRAKLPFTIGGPAGLALGHQFQGLIDEVRLTRKPLGPEELLINAEAPTADTAGYWQLKSEKDFYRDRSEHGNHIKLQMEQTKRENPRAAALEDLCHVLLNANEFVYVD